VPAPSHLAADLAAAHLADLADLPGQVCLLTDTRHRELARDGSVLDETDLLHGVVLPAPDDCWDWEVAPLGEISRRSAHVHRVEAHIDFRLADASAVADPRLRGLGSPD
jgi:hypothetical protein